MYAVHASFTKVTLYSVRVNGRGTTLEMRDSQLKGPYADHILIPQDSTESPYFSSYKSKSASNSLYFWRYDKSLLVYQKNNFLCIFIIASSPGVHTFFCLWRVKKKKLPQGETSQNAFQRSRSTN